MLALSVAIYYFFHSYYFSQILTTRFKVRIIRALLEEEEIRVLLDVGCGGAFMLSQLEDLYDIAIGIDMSPEAIEFGQLFTKAKLQVGNAEKLDFKVINACGHFNQRRPLLVI